MQTSIKEATVYYDDEYIVRKITTMENEVMVHLGQDDDIYVQTIISKNKYHKGCFKC